MEQDIHAKIIRLENYKSAKHMGELREYPDSYEYCVIPNYEDKFAELRTECIQMDQCFANIIRNIDHYVLVSIIFSDEWKVKEVVNWLENYELTFHRPTTAPIELRNCGSIIDAKKFKGYPIVLCKRGSKTISVEPSELTEVTEEYITYKKITNTQAVELVDEFLDKDDCLDRQYPGVADGEGQKPFEEIKENIQYSDSVRGLFVRCPNCWFEFVVVHNRTFEITEPFCPHCGEKVNPDRCEWVNGPF